MDFQPIAVDAYPVDEQLTDAGTVGPETAHLARVYLGTPRALIWRNPSSDWRLFVLLVPLASRLSLMRNPIFGALVLYIIANGAPGFDAAASGFASNGYGEHSPGGYSLGSAFVTEVVLTAGFLFIIMGATHGRAPVGFAPIAIGLGLTLIHLISIPVTNTSVNPARSTGPALFQGGWAIGQLWLFWVAPLIGGALGGVLYRWVSPQPEEPVMGGVRSPG